MNMEPQVSIVFTSYNHKKYLKKAIDSLLGQTFADFELIIVDDCSTDGSQEILKSYNDPRIRLCLKDKNGGSYVLSTNYGASMATAPYIIFAQCDDWAEPNQLERLVEKMEQNDVGVVFSCSNMVDEEDGHLGIDFDGREVKFKLNHSKDSVIQREDARKFLFHSCIIPNLSAALIRRDFYENLNGLSSEYLVLADWDFWLRMTEISDFYYIREPLNNFRQHASTIRSSIKMKRQVGEVYKMVFSFAKQIDMSKIRACHIAARLWIQWAVTGKKEWMRSCFSMLMRGSEYSAYYPIATMIEFGKMILKKF